MHPSVTFEGPIHHAGGGGAFVFFPFDTLELFGKKNLIPVHVIFDDRIEYQGRIANMGDGPMVPILKRIRQELQKEIGQSVKVKVTLDQSIRKVETPEWLKQHLVQATVLDAFKKWSYTKQKESVLAVVNAKKEETRKKRLAALVEALKGN
jgi:hypothetical protein